MFAKRQRTHLDDVYTPVEYIFALYEESGLHHFLVPPEHKKMFTKLSVIAVDFIRNHIRGWNYEATVLNYFFPCLTFQILHHVDDLNFQG
jgi:hypothetical protein